MIQTINNVEIMWQLQLERGFSHPCCQPKDDNLWKKHCTSNLFKRFVKKIWVFTDYNLLSNTIILIFTFSLRRLVYPWAEAVLGKNSRGKNSREKKAEEKIDDGKNGRWKKQPMEKTAERKNSRWKKQPME